jgi:hypothetical protein
MSATAETLIRDLSARGVRLSRNGDKLRVEAPAGVLTPTLRAMLLEAKPAILHGRPDARARERLLGLAAVEGIDPVLVHALTAGDLASCIEHTDDVLRAYLRALRDTALRERGWAPDDETATIRCARCGPVYAHPAVARVLPVVNGLPTAVGCTWCHNRGAGLPIPRPPNIVHARLKETR